MKEKIMIVDDHEDIREVVHVLLTNEGYQIIEAKDGKEALELLDDEIDLIILDVMMPEMNGYQACLLMREKTNDILSLNKGVSRKSFIKEISCLSRKGKRDFFNKKNIDY